MTDYNDILDSDALDSDVFEMKTVPSKDIVRKTLSLIKCADIDGLLDNKMEEVEKEVRNRVESLYLDLAHQVDKYTYRDTLPLLIEQLAVHVDSIVVRLSGLDMDSGTTTTIDAVTSAANTISLLMIEIEHIGKIIEDSIMSVYYVDVNTGNDTTKGSCMYSSCIEKILNCVYELKLDLNPSSNTDQLMSPILDEASSKINRANSVGDRYRELSALNTTLKLLCRTPMYQDINNIGAELFESKLLELRTYVIMEMGTLMLSSMATFNEDNTFEICGVKDTVTVHKTIYWKDPKKIILLVNRYKELIKKIDGETLLKKLCKEYGMERYNLIKMPRSYPDNPPGAIECLLFISVNAKSLDSEISKIKLPSNLTSTVAKTIADSITADMLMN